MGVMDLRRRIMLNEPHLVTTAPAGVASFSTDMIAPLKSCKVEFSPVQSGSGDPSPDNVRPISGWTGVNVHRTGKNLFNVDRTEGTPNPSDLSNATSPRVMDCTHYFAGLQSSNYYYKNYTIATVSNGTITVTNKNNNAYGVGFPVCVKSNTMYTLSFTAQNFLISFGYYDNEWHYLSQSISYQSINPITITTPEKTCYMVIVFRAPHNETATYTYSNIQLELGSTATPYEPYTGTTIPIDWTTEAGTVYGGYVDLVTGVLVATHAYLEKAISEMNTTDENYPGWKNSGVREIVGGNINANIRGVLTNISKLRNDSVGAVTVGTNDLLILQKSFFNLTGSSWKANYPNLVVQFVIPYAAPITYQLTTTQLKSLRGVNNIWSDANGDTTVKYWTH